MSLVKLEPDTVNDFSDDVELIELEIKGVNVPVAITVGADASFAVILKSSIARPGLLDVVLFHLNIISLPAATVTVKVPEIPLRFAVVFPSNVVPELV